MKNNIFLFLVAIFAVHASNAQEKKQPKYKISQFQLSFGGDRSFTPSPITKQDFPALAPGANIPFGTLPYDYQFGWNAGVLNMGVAFHPLNKGAEQSGYLSNKLFRLGISAQGLNTSIFNSSNSFTTRVDTLLSAASGGIYGFVDSIHQEFSYCTYSATAVKLDFSYVASTDASRRFSYYTGMGFSAGLTLSPRTEIQSHAWDSQTITDTSGNSISHSAEFNPLSVNREIYPNKIGYMGTLYVPLGINFRLSKKNEFLKKIHLFAEVRPTVSILNVPETKTYVYPNLQNNFGVKFEW